MTDEMLPCSFCTEGVLFATEIINDDPEERFIRHYYSCGHNVDESVISLKLGLSTKPPKMVSGAGSQISRNHREFEIEDRFKNNDWDQPGKETNEKYFRINDSDRFHLVKYSGSDDLKHIDCKICENDWKYQSGLPIEECFFFEKKPEVSYLESFQIRCLNCNNCWSWVRQKNQRI